MMVISIQDLRRIVDAVEQLRDRIVQNAVIRSDCRQLRLALDDGRILLVSALLDDGGKPRLDVDVLGAPAAKTQGQLEVGFEPGP
jgi:hypothetical protein